MPRRTVCAGWQRPRRELHGMKCFLKRQNRSEASTEREREGRTKEHFTKFEMSRARQWGLPWPMLFLRTAFINAASLNVAWRSRVWQGPRGAQSTDWGNSLCSQSPRGIPAAGLCDSLKKSENLGKNAPHWDAITTYEITAIYLFQKMFQIAQQVFRRKSQTVTFPQNSWLCMK